MPKLKQFDERVVLQEAINIFWQKGYHATSIQDLVKGLGINRASLYATYGNKKALFVAALMAYQANGRAVVDELLAAQSDVLEGLEELFRYMIQNTLNSEDCKGCFTVNTTTELLPNDEEIKGVLLQNQIQFEQLLTAYLQKGVTAGAISPDKDLPTISHLLLVLINGIQVTTKIEANPPKLNNMIPLVLALLQ